MMVQFISLRSVCLIPLSLSLSLHTKNIMICYYIQLIYWLHFYFSFLLLIFFSINLSMCKSVISFVIITFTDCNWDDGSKYRKYWPRTEEHSSIESTSCPGCLLGMLHDTTCQDFIKHYNNYNVIVMYIYLRLLLQFYLA